ncbi:uncharacterized protein Dana_GF10898 [Drosophila ananassae]|uniref:Uncharacterized protein n=1 Tax=Drosophila ananassae TaxID=7217 RepID=B3M9Y0_DROAN|nr:uncharacterized protein Dana_GF10898 [Drosophila ananassae]
MKSERIPMFSFNFLVYAHRLRRLGLSFRRRRRHLQPAYVVKSAADIQPEGKYPYNSTGGFSSYSAEGELFQI